MTTSGDTELIEVSIRDYLPGDYNLTIEVTDTFGQNASVLESFFLPGLFTLFSVVSFICGIITYYYYHTLLLQQKACCLDRVYSPTPIAHLLFSATHLWTDFKFHSSIPVPTILDLQSSVCIHH